jgi:hypothetical protein
MMTPNQLKMLHQPMTLHPFTNMKKRRKKRTKRKKKKKMVMMVVMKTAIYSTQLRNTES